MVFSGLILAGGCILVGMECYDGVTIHKGDHPADQQNNISCQNHHNGLTFQPDNVALLHSELEEIVLLTTV